MRSLTIALLVAAPVAAWSVVVAEDDEAPRPPVFAKDVAAALDEGFEIGAKHAQTAEGLLTRAEKAANGDPRVAYAAGLVWLKQLQNKRAVEEFEKATKAAGEAYWPAWQAWVWSALREKQFDVGMNRLQATVKKAVANIGVEGARDQIVWSGRVMGALQRVETSEKTQNLLIDAEDQLRVILGKNLVREFEEGKATLDEVHEELADKAEDDAAAQAERQKKAAAAAQAKVDETLAKAAKAKDDTRKSAEQWKNWMEDELKALDKQLTGHEKDYSYLTQRRASVQQSIALLGREITQIELTRSNRAGTAAQQIQQQLDQRNLQMINYQNELTATELQMLNTAQSGNATVLKKQEVIRQYERATGKLADQKAKADKWTERLAARKSQLKTKAAKPVATKPTISFVSLVPFDLNEKRELLEKELGVADPPEEPR